MFNTIFFQWINQSYNAGLNFGNKNSSCTYTNQDMIKGYLSAVGSALVVAITLRKMTSGMTKTATGKKLLLLNTFVGGMAGACASFCNTYCMRMAETEKGIEVFTDENLEKKAGISRLAATSAVTETALSRSGMSMMSVGIPCFLILALGGIGIAPKGAVMKNLLEISCVGFALLVGLPLSVSLFPPVSVKKGTELEKEFHSHEQIYFSKGL
jgi:hypothetical protein